MGNPVSLTLGYSCSSQCSGSSSDQSSVLRKPPWIWAIHCLGTWAALSEMVLVTIAPAPPWAAARAASPLRMGGPAAGMTGFSKCKPDSFTFSLFMLSLPFFLEGGQDLFRCCRHAVQADTHCIFDGIEDGRGGGNHGGFADALGTVRTTGVAALDDVCLGIGNIQGSGDQVGGKIGVQGDALVKYLFLHQGIAQAHGGPTFALTFHPHGIDGLAHIGGCHYAENIHLACFDIHLTLANRGVVVMVA